MALAQVDRFRKLKGAGFEAELAEVKEATEEAKATAEELRVIARSVAQMSLEALAHSGLFGGVPDARRIELKDDLESSLKMIGVPETDIKASSRRFVDLLKVRHAYKVQAEGMRAWSIAHADVPGGGVSAAVYGGDEYKAVAGKLGALLDTNTLSVAAPARYRKLLEEEGILSAEAEARLLDYEHFLEHGKLRRPDKFEE